MRRYHHSPSIPFLIARVDGPQEAIGGPVDGLNGPGGIRNPSGDQRPLEAAKNASLVFVASMWVAGVIIGVGLALELNGGGPYGLFVQAAGFFIAAVSVLRHPEEG